MDRRELRPWHGDTRTARLGHRPLAPRQLQDGNALRAAGASPAGWQIHRKPCGSVLAAGGTFGTPAGSKVGAALLEGARGPPRDPILNWFTWNWLSCTLRAQPCSQPCASGSKPPRGCFPLLLLFGCQELFWNWDVNMESSSTAGAVTRGRRSPPSEGRSAEVLVSPGKGELGGGVFLRHRAHALPLGETSSKPNEVSTNPPWSPHFGEPVQRPLWPCVRPH